MRRGRSSAGSGSLIVTAERAVATDRHRMCPHVLLTEDARPVVDAELPVVPRAREQVAVERALGQPVALVWAGVVEGVDAVGRAHEAEAPAVDAGEPHRSDGQILQLQAQVVVGHGCGRR